MSERELRCLLVGFAGGRLLLPGTMIVEVLPYATPLRAPDTPHWVLGSLLWRASEMFGKDAIAGAGEGGYVIIRDTTCRLFGYHGLDNGSAFSLDHMFGF